MDIKVTTRNEDGSVNGEFVLRPHEVEFVLEVGVNFLMANGASPFLPEEDEEDEVIQVDGPDTVQ